MIEIGAIISNITTKIKAKSESWLSDQVDIYNKLHDYNLNKTALFPNDPIGLKVFVPTRMSSVNPIHGNTSVCEFLDDDTVIFCAGSSDSGYILNTYTISTEEFSDDIVPHSSFGVQRALPFYRGASCFGGVFYKTSFGFAWVDSDGGVQYTSDNFSTITTISKYSFTNNFYRNFSSYLNVDNVVITYSVPQESYKTNYIVDVTYNTSTGTSSMGTEIPYSFSVAKTQNLGIYSGGGLGQANYLVKKIGDYVLLYHSYGYRTGLFFIDITGVDQYWYYIDPVFLNIFVESSPDSSYTPQYRDILSGIMEIKKIGNIFYFVFATEYPSVSLSKTYSTEDSFVLCKMESV